MRAAERPEFADIPADVKRRLERDLRRQAFEVLHDEAVQRGDLGAPPATWFNRAPGKILGLLFAASFGVLLGCIAVVLILYVARSLATVL
ncbi:MAG: hypothetical protein O3A20_00905 [Planctomycetota bacterium]|nr:hypothetical protein [Planctomycetota bacterium]